MWRESKGYKLAEFAILLDISNGDLSEIEYNKRKLSAGPVGKLVQKTDINIYWLYTGQGQMKREGPKKEAIINEEAGQKITPAEKKLIEDLRELDEISRQGILLTAATQFNQALQDKHVQKDKQKREILKQAIDTLKKAI